MNHLRVVIANDHPIVRESLRRLLEREPGLRVVGEAADAREAVLLSEYQSPDIAVLDVKLHGMNGIRAARSMLSKNAALRVIFLSALTDDEYVLEALKSGACAYVTSDSAESDLLPAVRVAAKGGFFLSPAITEKLIQDCYESDAALSASLSDYQIQLLCCLAEGRDENEIAEQLQSDPETVRDESAKVRGVLQQIGVTRP